MKKIILITNIFFIIGCSSAVQQHIPKNNHSVNKITSSNERPSLENIPEEQLGDYQEIKGVVFAKTNFEGILKARYVKLIFQDLEKNENIFQLYIGDKAKSGIAGDTKTVEPGYFFIELPAGKYKLASLSIPVGTTEATEDVNVVFNVNADRISYIGTLNVVGTKERIKLGGMPVIKPGFDYNLFVSNDESEAIREFHVRYPSVSSEILVDLMSQGQ